ncbi:MAG TPA: DUF5682 family protein [Polyangiaceae bacterium]|nr:DUF5682 family protein [Polyangiaceae bacterium]
MVEILPKAPALDALRTEILALASAFASDAKPLGDMLSAMVNDVARASDERLEIFPVCHHSPASALHLLRRLREKRVRVVFMEMCEDLQACVEGLASCKLPIALQAFATTSEVFPSAWSPLSVVAPITEFSAEYQAIAFAANNPETDLVFIDRSVDHIFQWMPKDEEALDRRVHHEDEDEEDGAAAGEEKPKKAAHGSAIGVQVGRMEPTFDAFLEHLLKNARVRHFAEWWDQYVEQAVIGSDYETYRHILFLVGSLLRRLGRREDDRREDRLRERFMWTRMKSYLREKGIDPSEAIYICGAAHAATEVEEFGTKNDKVWEIPPRTDTKWLYGLIPSSFVAIEHQFGNPAGTVSMCESSWNKALTAMELTPFRITKTTAQKAAKKAEKPAKPAKGAKGKAAASPEPAASIEPVKGEAGESREQGLHSFLTRPPSLAQCDEEELLHWCVEIVKLARENGYLTSTADTIAIYHTAILLAGIRNRNHPSPYDFEDAAVTCLEKDRTPKKRTIRRLCEILLGGDRSGMVGYESLPPLAKDVYDRLAPLGLNLNDTRIQRALIDFKVRPELLPCSDLLWRLSYLMPRDETTYIVHCTTGERTLGNTPIQESWDIRIRQRQAALIQLAYEGVSIESVLERRLKEKAHAPKAGPTVALEAVEDSIAYLKSPRLTAELGERAIALLVEQTGAREAPGVFDRVRRLVHYYRSTPHGLPDWLKRFVTTGYSHYATLLPASFQDQGTRPEEVSGMLAFLFTLESLALSFGCERSQLVIAVKQAGGVTEDPTKIGLLWSAEWLLGIRDIGQIRAFLDEVLSNVMMLPAFPSYIGGFLLALGFTPLVGRLVVELLSKAFERLPDEVLMPWMPSLLMGLRPLGADLVATLVKEASACFPAKLNALGGWKAPWEESADPVAEEAAGGAAEAPRGAALGPEEASARALCAAHPAMANALAAIFGEAPAWNLTEAKAEAKPAAASRSAETQAAAPAGPSPSSSLLEAHPAALNAMAAIFA